MQNRAHNKYFSFTYKERNGTVFLLIIILLLTVIPFIYPLFFREKAIDTVDIQKELAEITTKQHDSTQKKYKNDFDRGYYQNNYQVNGKNFSGGSVKKELFYFDPNSISAEGWKKLGVRDKTINTIFNFISKGGKFRKPEDIEKIWGLHENDAKRLIPFVRIAETVSSNTVFKTGSVLKQPEQKRSFEMIDINLADTNALIRLPGIGSKLSIRIINFREKLGGFYSVEQVAETFGIADSVFNKIRHSLILNEKKLKRLNINTASLDELKQHPYIRYNLANLIVQYRLQHGNFSDISAITKIITVTDDLYNKLSPYLSVD